MRRALSTRCGFVLLLCGLLVSAPARAMIVACDGHEEHLNTYLSMVDVLWNQRDGSRVLEFYNEEFISHNSDEGEQGKRTRHVTELQHMWERSKRVDPERHMTTDVVICNGDFLVARVTGEGRMLEGPMKDYEGGGRRWRNSSMEIYRFENGKIAERWANSDLITFIRQLGLDLDLSYQPLED